MFLNIFTRSLLCTITASLTYVICLVGCVRKEFAGHCCGGPGATIHRTAGQTRKPLDLAVLDSHENDSVVLTAKQQQQVFMKEWGEGSYMYGSIMFISNA